jgi:hypothetical protein
VRSARCSQSVCGAKDGLSSGLHSASSLPESRKAEHARHTNNWVTGPRNLHVTLGRPPRAPHPSRSECPGFPINCRAQGQFRALNIADPIKDLDSNLDRWDTQFVGINGYTCSAPGLDQSAVGPDLAATADQRLEQSHGVICIDGTGDVMPPDDRQYMDLYQTAWKYAEMYNHELLVRIHSGQVK